MPSLPERRPERRQTDRCRIVNIFPCGQKGVSAGGRRGTQFPSQSVRQRQSLRDIPSVLRVQGERGRLNLCGAGGGCVQIRLSCRQKILNDIRRVAQRTPCWMHVEKHISVRPLRISACGPRRSRKDRRRYLPASTGYVRSSRPRSNTCQTFGNSVRSTGNDKFPR